MAQPAHHHAQRKIDSVIRRTATVGKAREVFSQKAKGMLLGRGCRRERCIQTQHFRQVCLRIEASRLVYALKTAEERGNKVVPGEVRRSDIARCTQRIAEQDVQ